MGDLGFLAAGFGAAWLAIGVYLVYLWRAERRIDDRLRALEREGVPRSEEAGADGEPSETPRR